MMMMIMIIVRGEDERDVKEPKKKNPPLPRFGKDMT